MIHGAGHYSDECKVLGVFGTKYASSQSTKYHRSDPIPRKRLQEKQQNHDIINNVVDELQIIESNKVSAVNHEAP